MGLCKVYYGFAGLTLLSLVACDPCGLALGCSQWPRAAVLGQVIDEGTGRPLGGVRVELRRQGGVGLQPDATATTTGDDGLFQLETTALEAGDATVTISIAAPGWPAYEVPDVQLQATVRTGEATVLVPWSSGRPTLPYVLEFYRNDTDDERVVNAPVEFRRTSGAVMLSGDTPVPSVTKNTNDIGWVYLFRGLTTDRAGDVVGDLIVRLPPPIDSAVIRGVRFPALPQFRPADGGARLGVGPG